MVEIEFIYNGVKTVVQISLDEKMKVAIQKFLDKVKEIKIYYIIPIQEK